MTSPPLPLLHDGDAYSISLDLPSPTHVRILSITHFANNENVVGEAYAFRDLPPDVKRAVVTQINRRYIGKMVLT